MKTVKKIIKAAFIFYIMAMIAGCEKKEAPQQDTAAAVSEFSFKVQFVLGDVKILKADKEAAVNVGEQIDINDVIITGKKSSLDILYGTSGVIRINENSRISIAAIADNQNNNTVLNMDKGSVFAAFSKLKGTEFNVKTPTVVASVRGTSFSVVSDKSGAKVSVLKGTVSAAPVKDGNIIENKAIEVQANQKTDYVSEKTVDKIVAQNKTINVSAMSTAETVKLQEETKTIKMNIDEIQNLSPQEKEDIKKKWFMPRLKLKLKKQI